MVNDQDAGTARRRAIREDLARDIEMSYEVLFAFEQMHGDDPDADMQAAWGAAREQAEEAIAKELDAADAARASAEAENTRLRVLIGKQGLIVDKADASREALRGALRELEKKWRVNHHQMKVSAIEHHVELVRTQCASELAALLASEPERTK